MAGLLSSPFAPMAWADDPEEPEGPIPGTLVEEFAPAGFNDEVFSIKVDAEGRIVAGGWFTQAGGQPRGGVARLTSEGELDDTFTANTTGGPVVDLSVAENGDILLGGAFTQAAGAARSRLARVDDEGNLVESFDPAGPLDDRVTGIREMADGSVVVSGWFSLIGGDFKVAAAKFGPDGTLDTTFAGGGANNVISAVEVLPDGRVLFGGAFTSFNGQPRNRLVMVDGETGAPVNDFNIGTGFSGPVTAVLPLPDGRILVGGNFMFFNGVERARLALLNADGSLAATFNPGAGPNGAVNALAVDSGGRFLVGGAFNEYNGTPVNRLVRLLPNGTLDETFETGEGASGTINSIVYLPEEQIALVAGSFTFFAGQSRARLAAVHAGGEAVGTEGRFPSWLAENFTSAELANGQISGPAADPDGDGVPNLLEYAFGGDPKAPGTAPLPTLSTTESGGQKFLQISFARVGEANDIEYHVQASEDLANWETIWNSAGQPMAPGDGVMTQTVTDDVAADGSRFLRVAVVYTGEVIEPPPPPEGYTDWAGQFFSGDELNDPAVSGPNADPDGDGVRNLMEYALGGDPQVPNTAMKPVVTTEAGEGGDFLNIHFPRMRDAAGIVYKVQASANLASWETIWSSADHPYTSTESMEMESVPDVEPVSAASPRFLRLIVETAD